MKLTYEDIMDYTAEQWNSLFRYSTDESVKDNRQWVATVRETQEVRRRRVAPKGTYQPAALLRARRRIG